MVHTPPGVWPSYARGCPGRGSEGCGCAGGSGRGPRRVPGLTLSFLFLQTSRFVSGLPLGSHPLATL